MQGRLSELLERIRPAGSPGAPTEGEQTRRADHDDELTDVKAVLSDFEHEARALLDRARDDAARIGRVGAQRSRAIRATLPEQVAQAETQAEEANEAFGAEAESALTAETARQLALLRQRADERLPGLVEQAVELLWTGFIPPESGAGPTVESTRHGSGPTS